MNHTSIVVVGDRYQSICNDIKDMCLELSDNGFKYTLTFSQHIYLEIWKPKDSFIWKQIEDVIERLIDYLSKNGKSVNLTGDWKYTALTNEGKHVLFKSQPIKSYSITFYERESR